MRSIWPTRETAGSARHAHEGLLAQVGRYRTTGVGVVQGSRVVHVAPRPSALPALVADLLRWLQTDREVHPLVKAAVVHYEIELIHPFADGNGRIGRLWQHVILSQWHRVFEYVPVESIIHSRQEEYYRVLGLSDRAGDSTPFVEFALEALRDALSGLVGDLRAERSTVDTRSRRLAEPSATRSSPARSISLCSRPFLPQRQAAIWAVE